MARPSKKEQILREGLEVVRRRGFNAAGVRDITSAAGVPQGSFTNHFTSKEAFGLEILDRYFADVHTTMAATVEGAGSGPLERLRAYFDAITDRLEDRGWHHGCLIGNMSLEVAEHSEAIRARLTEIFSQWREPFARCLLEAEAAGQIRLDVPAVELADFLITSWQGAILRMKVERTPEPLERFKRVVFATVIHS
ncbi:MULTISPECIES: TetR/AcrR family transcriptional regulator [Streptosporangium]|uniref:TetR/AcrR family transcriptional repressor of nem operon n=1 Tax=Streptosporangium brasiliense TaxID=47480 RepID=A0ABT9QX92_9ACTN|nr:TetR/AcrR family transcriptional regulator [Streptosporangium brasiliense]MDP9861217.1 TetR/AcrR family transcriptional repressor of nem operon [Streptosporangium brasiliense]